MKKEPKVFEVRKLFRVLVVGGTLTAAGCGAPCPNATPTDGGVGDGGAMQPTNCEWAGNGGGGGVHGW